jgi:hypothetical protein
LQQLRELVVSGDEAVLRTMLSSIRETRREMFP